MVEARRWWVAGRVQGVYFRVSTREQALALGLAGQAVNLADGRVEVVAEGESSALDALAQWLRQGPPLACVETLFDEPLEPAGRRGFSVG